MACCSVVQDPFASTANALKQNYSRYSEYPEYVEIVLGDETGLPTGEAFHQELGSRFAVACQDLGAELNLDPAALADAYTDPQAFDANGEELNMCTSLEDAKLPITFKFKKQAQKYHVLTGLKGAGKTSIMKKLKTSVGRDVLCSFGGASSGNGFPVQTLELDDFASIAAWNAPPCENNPMAWRPYLLQAVSLIFVVDSANLDAVEAAKIELENMLQEMDSTTVPTVLIYANKQDVGSALSATALVERLDLAKLCHGRRWFVQSSCAVTGDGVYQGITQLSKMLSVEEAPTEATEAAEEGAMTSDVAVPQVVLSEEDSRVAEIVLECIHNDGVDVLSVPTTGRTIVFPLESDSSVEKLCPVGRSHQPGFFEALVPRQDRLLAISRTHLSITASFTSAGPVLFSLKHMSKNPLILDNIRSIRQNEEVSIKDGTWIGLKDLNPGEGPFLVLRVTLRTQGAVLAEGSLFSEVEELQAQRVASSLQAAQTTMRIPSVLPVAGKSEAVLECTFAAGRDVNTMPRNSRSIGMPLDTAVAMGRTCQPGFFEYLLNNDPQWLIYISRTQCELTLTSEQSWWGFGATKMSLVVENLSKHFILLEQQALAKEEWDELAEGGTLSFAAVVDGQTTKFLQFTFRKVDSAEELVPVGTKGFKDLFHAAEGQMQLEGPGIDCLRANCPTLPSAPIVSWEKRHARAATDLASSPVSGTSSRY